MLILALSCPLFFLYLMSWPLDTKPFMGIKAFEIDHSTQGYNHIVDTIDT